MSVFRAYDIRGIAGKEITPELAYLIGRAHVVFTGAHTVVVGKDMRLSSEESLMSLPTTTVCAPVKATCALPMR